MEKKKRTKGEWLKHPKKPHVYKCSVCGALTVQSMAWNYCPMCGSKMIRNEKP